MATEPQTKTIQGLWSELFLIAESVDPVVVLRSWHSLPEEKYDFNSGEERVEVKSCSGSRRVHTFSLDQLNGPIGTQTVIASVFVKHVSGGKNISMLVESIMNRIPNQSGLIEKLKHQVALALGKSINEGILYHFDFYLAKQSLRFYKIEDIPRIKIDDIPLEVHDVHFKTDLTNVEPVRMITFSKEMFLFPSIMSVIE